VALSSRLQDCQQRQLLVENLGKAQAEEIIAELALPVLPDGALRRQRISLVDDNNPLDGVRSFYDA